jgi:hypothetical protein
MRARTLATAATETTAASRVRLLAFVSYTVRVSDFYPNSGSSVGDPAAGRRDTVILVTSPIRSQAWIAQGKWNRDERVAPFIEHEFDSADVAVKELIRGWSILLVCQLAAAGRTGPGHDGSRPAQSTRIRLTDVPAMFTLRTEKGLQEVALRGENRVCRLTSWADRVRHRCGRLREHAAVLRKHEKSVCAKQHTLHSSDMDGRIGWPDRERGHDPRDVFTRDMDLARGREREIVHTETASTHCAVRNPERWPPSARFEWSAVVICATTTTAQLIREQVTFATCVNRASWRPSACPALAITRWR